MCESERDHHLRLDCYSHYEVAQYSYSALDPMQELAYDNECSVEELREYLANHKSKPAPSPVEEDDVPF